MALNDAFKNANDSEWKKLCMKYYDFIEQQVSSNKFSNLNAAKFAAQHDWEMINFMKMNKKTVTQKEDKLLLQLS